MKKLLNMKKLTYIALMIAAVCSVGCKSDVFEETDVTATPIIRLYATTTDTPGVDDAGNEVIIKDGVTYSIIEPTTEAPQYYNYYYAMSGLYTFSSQYVIKDYISVSKVESDIIKGVLVDQTDDKEHEYTKIELSFYRTEMKILRDINGNPLDSNHAIITNPTADSDFAYEMNENGSYKSERVKYILRAESCTYLTAIDPVLGEYAYDVSDTGTVAIRRVTPYDNSGVELTFDESTVLLYVSSNSVLFEYKNRYVD